MIQKLFEYVHDEVNFKFFRDDKFTIAFSSIDNPRRVMFGTAFCTREDEYRVDVGCHVALERLCKNLKLDVESRISNHEALDKALSKEEGEFEKKLIEDLEAVEKHLDEVLLKYTGKNSDELFGKFLSEVLK